MLITGNIPPYYTEEEIENDTRNLYVNIQTLELEYFIKYKMENNPLWVNLTDIFQKKITARDITRKLEEKLEEGKDITREQEDLIYDNYNKIERIKDREFLEQTIPVKASIKEAIDIFYIVNASWVNLTDAELALAQISGYRPEARDLFKEKLDELEEQGFVFKLDFLVYVMLGVLHFNGSEMEKLHHPENKEKMVEAWKLLSEKVLDYVCNIMRSHAFIDHTKEINSVYALVPIIIFAFHKEKQTFTQQEIQKIVKRFYYSQIRQRYISQLPQKLDKDLSIVRDSHSPFDSLLNLIAQERPLTIHEDEFIGVDVRNALYALMKWYFKSKGAVCLTTWVSLHKNMGKKYDLEQDHIFAYSILKEKGYGMNNRHKYALAQEITNRAVLSQIANRSKLDMDADVYLKQVQEKFPNALKLQCIPENEELRKIENYELFLKKRREILAQELNLFLEWLTQTEETEDAVSIDDMIKAGESKYLEFKSSLRRDTVNWNINKALEQVILKVISSFNNAEGGTLLVGVNDEGRVLWLENDYQSLSGNRDEFELHLTNILNKTFWADFGATQVDISFPIVHEQEICMIEVKAGNKPLYLEMMDKNGQKKKKLFVRSGNSSQEFDDPEALGNYIKTRF